MKAIVINGDNVSSGILAQTYLVNVSHDLPIVSLTAVNYDLNGGEANKLTIDGQEASFNAFLGLLDTFPFWCNIVTP